jgi:hypothetical protein
LPYPADTTADRSRCKHGCKKLRTAEEEETLYGNLDSMLPNYALAHAEPRARLEGEPTMPAADSNALDAISRFAQVFSVVAGVVVSVLSFNATRVKEAEVRRFETQKYYDQRADQAEKQQIEAAKPFLQLRQKRYEEAVRTSGVLANPSNHTPEELKAAEKRFWELYWSELSLVESQEVETAMVELGKSITGKAPLTERQTASYNLAHDVRASLLSSWGIEDKDEPERKPDR